MSATTPTSKCHAWQKPKPQNATQGCLHHSRHNPAVQRVSFPTSEHRKPNIQNATHGCFEDTVRWCKCLRHPRASRQTQKSKYHAWLHQSGQIHVLQLPAMPTSEHHRPRSEMPRMVACTLQDTILWCKCLRCPPASTTSPKIKCHAWLLAPFDHNTVLRCKCLHCPPGGTTNPETKTPRIVARIVQATMCGSLIFWIVVLAGGRCKHLLHRAVS